MTPTIGCVLLTMGNRPVELAAALESLLAQRDVDLDLVVVGNGWTPVDLPDRVRTLALPENVGIPAGRNAGVPLVTGELVFFLDDDARLVSDRTLAQVADFLHRHPDIGLLQPRVVDTDTGTTVDRWVPRLRTGDPSRSSDACSVWEGALAMRRTAFQAVGGWTDAFFYFHEGIDLAWRVWDAGYRVRYAGDIVVHHPVVPQSRRATFQRTNVRNRIFVARRLLPVPLAVCYLTVWALATALRLRRWHDVRQALAGIRAGFTEPCGGRRPIGWRTAWRMTRAGRPPVL
ncbi:MAG TPA: glycosyltransferase [Mycobacteriales bacterium]|jgi:GT2 family glycosyltransferase|nr:glycosyltransferase [Mycobacteriales bacterium]